MKYLYKYPQEAFRYAKVIGGDRHRSPNEPEYDWHDASQSRSCERWGNIRIH
jgi:hypothetical protein